MTGTPMLLVLTTLPDEDTARRIAHDMVARGLAACVSIGAPVRSVYRWNQRIEDSVETPLTLKTSTARYDELEQALRAAHPYELPEIIALPVERGLAEYLLWVDEMTGMR
jgi:periplasmic divalent cation tolerance protein